VLLLAGSFLNSIQAQTSSNTLVRFRLSAGTTFIGDIVVELFDQEKPITVRNFLDYLRSGQYKNTILHRCERGYILQGGLVGVCNPFVGAYFDYGYLVETNPPIVNETQFGPLISNTFGTLAMATAEGDPNSAAASWFFNLSSTNATFLNTNNGGYCVFGRVTSGTNLLSQFNSIYTTPAYFPATSNCCLLGHVPVPYLQAPYANYYPLYSDLFVVEITELTNGIRTDSLKPTVAITMPRLGSTFSNDTVTLLGTASDASGIRSVDVYFVDAYFNLDCPVPASGTTSWSLILTNPPPGTNLVIVQSTDNIGNRSPIAYRTFFQSARTPITLNVEPPGSGTIVGATDGQLLEVNRRYVITAQPSPGYLFAGWTGSVEQASASLAFYMQSNDTFTATFVPNRFPLVKGVYNGVFFETNNEVRPNSSGFITFTIGDSVHCSGKLLMEGKSYPFSSEFSVYGDTSLFVQRPAVSSFVLLLASINLENPDGMITGEVRGPGANGWFSGFHAYRQVTNGAPYTGKHTLLIPGGPDASTSPPGDSIGAVSVDVAGRVNFAGTLADGTRVQQRVVLGQSGRWALYVPLYGGKGSLLGEVQFDPTQPMTDLSGPVTWSKLAQTTTRFYPRGFTNATQLLGSRYTAPADSAHSALNFSNGEVGFSDGNLTMPFTNHIAVGPGDRITNQSLNRLTLTLTRTTGLFGGSATVPASTRVLSFKGAWLQKAGMGAGFFPGTNEGGRVVLEPQAP
jgi:uncharacterized repeat protein (TIGR02543 family)